MENILHDRQESGVIQMRGQALFGGFTNSVPPLQIGFDPGEYC